MSIEKHPAMSSVSRRALCGGFVASVCVLPSAGLAQGVFDMLTEAEIDQWRRAAADPTTRSMKLASSDGPEIIVAAPNGYALTSPVDFDVRIVPRDNVPVSMQTLRVHYRIGPIWTDVTARISDNARIAGTHLTATGARLPSGRHTVRLTVADVRKRTTVAVVRFAVI